MKTALSACVCLAIALGLCAVGDAQQVQHSVWHQPMYTSAWPTSQAKAEWEWGQGFLDPTGAWTRHVDFQEEEIPEEDIAPERQKASRQDENSSNATRTWITTLTARKPAPLIPVSA